MTQDISASEMSRLEVLGYHRLSEEDKADFSTLFARTEIYPITRAIIELGIKLRQQKKMSIGDGIIAATALTCGEVLATRNIDDFNWIEGLSVLNSLEEHRI